MSAHFSFGPLSTYLAVNYLDRFLSAYDLPVRTIAALRFSVIRRSIRYNMGCLIGLVPFAEGEGLDNAVAGCGMYVPCSQIGGD